MMDHKISWLAWMVCGGLLVASPGLAGAVDGTDAESDVLLQVHLPREVMVQDSHLSLSQVSVIRGPGVVVAKASKVGLGRFSVPGQKVVLDRPTILSCLASSGIPSAQVRLTGAEAVTVRRQLKIVETADLIAAAEQFLRQFPAARAACKIIPVIRPKDLVLSEVPEQVELKPRLVRRGARGQVTVEVAVMVDGRNMGTRNVAFRLRYERRRVVAIDQIPEGTVLSPENVKIEAVESDWPEPVGWKPPYGQATIRTVPANAAIRADMIGPVRSAVFVRRNQTVQIRLDRAGLLVTAMGTALQEAHAGECLKVRNADSNRIIICRVKVDGTVEPML